MKVASCQLPDVWNDLPRALSLIRRYAVAAQKQGVHLLCFPECFLSGYQLDSVAAQRMSLETDGPEFQQILKSLGDLNIALVIGFMERRDDDIYNAAAVISQGRLYGVHHKVHLLGVEGNVFQAGTDCAVYQLNGLHFGVNICNDLNEPALADALQRQGAKALICPVNNLLPRQFAAKWKQLHTTVRCQLAQSTGLWVVSADVTGIRGDSICYGSSSIIDPEGRVIERLPSFSTGLISANIPAD